MAGAIFGVIMSTTLPVLEEGPPDMDEIFSRIDKGLALLEAGLPL